MLDIYFSLFGLYFFVLAGFFLKKKFKEKLDAKSLVVISIYFAQPVLGFWGFTQSPLSWEIISSGIIYFLSVFIVLGILVFGVRYITKDKKLQTLLTFTGTSGNTGNIGIPLGGIFGGPSGIVIASMINFWNILWNFIFGVYFYARGERSIQHSLIEIFKLPILWASVLGILCNILDIEISDQANYFLELGAYTAIVLQLLLLGIFMAGIQIKKMSYTLSIWISLIKCIAVPLAGFFLLWIYQLFWGELSSTIITITLIQLCAPIATNNANLATLYNCLPEKVAESIFISYLIFFFFAPPLFYWFL